MNKLHTKLDIWREAMELVSTIYELTPNFSSFEKFGLASQLQIAAVSIPSYIAEGAAR